MNFAKVKALSVRKQITDLKIARLNRRKKQFATTRSRTRPRQRYRTTILALSANYD